MNRYIYIISGEYELQNGLNVLIKKDYHSLDELYKDGLVLIDTKDEQHIAETIRDISLINMFVFILTLKYQDKFIKLININD